MNETKKSIIRNARILFSEKDFEQVTIREIAKKAGISHTTLYLYFKTKQEIIITVALEPLEELFNNLNEIDKRNISIKEKCLAICNTYICFGIEQKSIYTLISMYEGERVDLNVYSSPISEIRMKNFTILKNNIITLLPKNMNEQKKLNIVRGTFFFLHGVIMTYTRKDEKEIERIEKIVRDYLEFTIISTNH